MKQVVRIWCEYDYGQDDIVFATTELAENWLRKAIIGQADGNSFDELMEDGLISTEAIDYMEK